MSFSEEALYNQKGLDVDAALEFVGDIDLYREILYDYYEDIDPKCERVEEYIKTRNAKEYTVEVHAIKSASRTIGATELSQRALLLEQYGEAGDWDAILRETPGVLETYKGYKDIVSPYMVKAED